MPTISGVNYPGTWEVELIYLIDAVEHKQKLNCEVQGTPSIGDDPSTITLETRDSVGVALDTAITAWANLLKPTMPSACTFTGYNFYKYLLPSFNKDWYTTGSFSIVGTGVGGVQKAQQSTYTFRSNQGGRMRMQTMESSGSFTAQLPYSGLGASDQAIIDFMLSDDAWMIARDNGYPASFIKYSGTQNETLYNKYYR